MPDICVFKAVEIEVMGFCEKRRRSEPESEYRIDREADTDSSDYPEGYLVPSCSMAGSEIGFIKRYCEQGHCNPHKEKPVF